MKPRELYNGPAPAAMAQMGQGISEAGARIGEFDKQRYESIGKSISSGIQAAAGAYADYKKMSSGIKSSENFFQSMKDSGYLDPKLSAGIDQTVNGEAYKNMGTADKAAYWENLKSFTGQSISNQAKMQQIGVEQAGATGRTAMSEAGATERNMASLEASRLRQQEELKSLEARTRASNIINFMGSNISGSLDKGNFSGPFGRQTLNLGGGIYNSP